MMHTAVNLCLIVFGVVCVITAEDGVFDDLSTSNSSEPHVEYHPYDGWFNNVAHPEWGAAETQLFRRVPPAYSDGVLEPSGKRRPNPIKISDIAFAGESGYGSNINRTALIVFFGQQMVEEILDAQRPGCPPEYFNIPIPRCHPLYDKNTDTDCEKDCDTVKCKAIPLLRTRYDMSTGFSPNAPRQQLNEVSSFIDGTLVYGPGKAWADKLRLFRDGRLKSTNDSNDEIPGSFPAYNEDRLPYSNPPPPRDHKLKNVGRFYMIGNPRGNENPFLLTFGILWFRYHNYMAKQLKQQHPEWNDERLFNEARKWTIATYQSIVMYAWVPNWIAVVPEYTGYDPTVHPGIAHVFQTSAMRFGHTMVPPGVYRRSKRNETTGECTFYMTTDKTVNVGEPALRTCNTFWNPQEGVDEYDIDELLMGMASQVAEREDNVITPDLRDNVFGPLEFSRRPLMAINIQRGRDHGVADYNTVREHYNLPRKTSFAEINPALNTTNPQIFADLSELYGNSMDDLDLFPMGILETAENRPGEIFRAIVRDQFIRIRDGDRFWFENTKNGLFTQEEIGQLKNTTLKDVILAVTNIGPEDIQDNPFIFADGDPCPQPQQLLDTDMENCSALRTYDYFKGSEVSYALSFTFILATLPICIGILIGLVEWKKKNATKEERQLRESLRRQTTTGLYSDVQEWVGKKEGYRLIQLTLRQTEKQINIENIKGGLLRKIDLSPLGGSTISIHFSADKEMKMLLVRFPREYDLVLKFNHVSDRHSFHEAFLDFLTNCNLNVASPETTSQSAIMKTAFTKSNRKKLLEEFYRATMFQAFQLNEEGKVDTERFEQEVAENVFNCELTKLEFAESLAMKPDSLFVKNMFEIVDKDNNGLISFREFLDMFVIFYSGSADDKAKLMFKMYDLDRDGQLTRAEFQTMIRSLLQLTSVRPDDGVLNELVNTIFTRAGTRERLTFDSFIRVVGDFQDELQFGRLSLKMDAKIKVPKQAQITRARNTIFGAYKSNADNPVNMRKSAIDKMKVIEQQLPKSKQEEVWRSLCKYVSNYRLQIFWVTLYTLVTIGIFLERFYHYSVESEHGGLRQITGLGVSFTRGAASAMMFTYSSLLVVMCRNTITLLRETFLHQYIPFDYAVPFHKFIAWMAAIYTLAHIIGHAFNFYHISTQTADDLTCLFRNFFHATDELPTFTYWLWATITGVTGVLLTIHMFIIYTFAVPYARRYVYKSFWITHNTYIIFFILMILHGAGRLVQAPYFQYFFLGPVCLYTIDKLVSISRKKVEVTVIDAEVLPSDVVYLRIQKPHGFNYKSGQWLRLACVTHSSNEYHPFTITSAPQDGFLSLHIRAVGPWTINISNIYDKNNLKGHGFPKVFLDGPYGEGHQDWYRYEVAILIGAGIGVTPFASILKDISNRCRRGDKISCKKVYFIWITRNQHGFEWMTDIIKEVEEQDNKDIVSTHVFITQFKEKYDFRTAMLYVCERFFQKVSHQSLFTGLQSVTHFGRPDFKELFELIQGAHITTNEFGVFSCGPPPVTSSVDKACQQANKYIKDVLFKHHCENF